MTLTYKKSIPKKSMPAKIMKHSFVDEAMVDLSEYFMGRILIEPIYYNNGLKGAIEKCCVRESVAKKLERGIKIFTPKTKENYLLGNRGDYLVVSCDDINDIKVVEKHIFRRLYQKIEL